MPEMRHSQRLSLIQAKTERIKGWGAIIAIIATNAVTLVTAVTAHLKEEKEETAKAAYKELSGAIKKISEDNVQLHKDVANIRGYLAGRASKSSYRVVEEDDNRSLAQAVRDAINNKYPRNAQVREVEEYIPPPKIESNPEAYEPPSINEIRKK